MGGGHAKQTGNHHLYVQALDMSLVEASKRVSTYAADFIGEPQRGRLQVGAFADWVELDPALQVQRVVVEGEDVTRT